MENINWGTVALAAAWLGFVLAVVSLVAVYELRKT